jgi:hypothetical protein
MKKPIMIIALASVVGVLFWLNNRTTEKLVGV